MGCSSGWSERCVKAKVESPNLSNPYLFQILEYRLFKRGDFMSILIGSARHDEHGNITGGKAGDQLQRLASDGLDHFGEVSVQEFYNHKKGWVILRPVTNDLANGLAFCMMIACNNANIGYNQNTRYGVYEKGILTDIPVNSDCSELVRTCIKQCGYTVPDFNTSSEAKVLVNSGMFRKVDYTKASDLYIGDVLVTKTKGHTVIVVSGAKSRSNPAQTVVSANPYKEPTEIIQKGSKGEGVKWVQWQLNRFGANLLVDGDAGKKTDIAIRAFQKGHRLVVDGQVGKKTREALKNN